MPNFLEQLTKTGALNVVNPMESYQKALKTKGFQTDIRTAELDQESKVLELGREYLSRVQNQDEYQNYRTYMTDKLGVDPSLLPESFESDEDFESWRETAIYGVEELSKLRKGQEADFTIRRPDGSTSNVKMTQEQLQKNIDAGLVDKENVMVGKLSKESFEREAARKKAVKTAELEATAEVETEPEFGEPYVDERTGALLQKSEKTGKITKVASPPKGWTIESDGEGGFRMVMGGTTDLTAPAKTKLQKDIIGLSQQLSDLKVLGQDYKRAYLTYGGKIKRFALREASKLGADIGEGGKEFVQGARRFQEGVEQVFNAYRKEITGAQAAMKEISMLRDSILNKNLAPDEFDASYNRYIEQIQRQLNLKKYYLHKGFTGEELGEKIDTSVVAGDQAIDLRGDEIEQELIDKNIPEDQIEQEVLKQLKSEGYY